MSIGAYSAETDIQRGKRRIVVGYFVFSALFRGAGVVELPATLVGIVLLGVLALRADRFLWIVDAALFFLLVEVLAGTIILGGLVPSDLTILWGLLAVVGALIVLPVGAAFWWLLAYGLTLMLAVVLPEHIEPVHVVEGTTAGIASTIAGVTFWVFAAMAYFVRQRDRFQKQSDDLLHAILPDEIAQRLKSEKDDDRRRSRIGLGLVRRRGRLHADVGHDVPARTRGVAERRVHDVRRVRGGVGSGEDQNRGRRIHGCRRRAARATRSRTCHRRAGSSESATTPSGTGSTAMTSVCVSGSTRAPSSPGDREAPTNSPTICGVMS